MKDDARRRSSTAQFDSTVKMVYDTAGPGDGPLFGNGRALVRRRHGRGLNRQKKRKSPCRRSVNLKHRDLTFPSRTDHSRFLPPRSFPPRLACISVNRILSSFSSLIRFFCHICENTGFPSNQTNSNLISAVVGTSTVVAASYTSVRTRLKYNTHMCYQNRIDPHGIYIYIISYGRNYEGYTQVLLGLRVFGSCTIYATGYWKCNLPANETSDIHNRRA